MWGCEIGAEPLLKPGPPRVEEPGEQEQSPCLPPSERSNGLQQLQQELRSFGLRMLRAEAIARVPWSSLVCYSQAKEELDKFESLGKQVEEAMVWLGSMGRKCRRLASEPRASEVKRMVPRVDILHRRVGTICRRLKYFIGQREAFESKWDHLRQQLVDSDLRLTQLEQCSRDGAADKIDHLQGLQQEVTCVADRMGELLEAADTLLQKSEPSDAEDIEAKVWDLLHIHWGLFTRTVQFHKRFHQARQEFDESSNGEGACGCKRELAGWGAGEGWGTLAREGGPSDVDSGRTSPSSSDSLTLQWDSSVDIGDAGVDEETHSSAAGRFIGLELTSCGTSRQDWGWSEADWSSPEQVCVGHQCGSEVGAVSDEQGPGEAELHKTTAGPAFSDPGLGQTTVAMRRMREEEVDRQVGQRRDCEPPRVQLGRDQLHPEGEPGPMSASPVRDSEAEQWPHTTEPEQRRGRRGAPALGEGSGDSIRLRLPLGPARKSYLPLGRRLQPPVCLQHLCRLLPALCIFLVLALMAAIFLLPSLATQYDWHRRNSFLLFHFALTYPNGPPPT